MGEVLSQDKLKQRLSRLKSEGRSVVFTNGCFDILHVGHIRYLQEARSLGDVLVVGLNADASVRRLKGEARPVQCEDDRAEILAALEAVSFVTLFTEDTPQNLIENWVQPDVLVKGGDWPVEKIVGSQYVLSHGGRVKSLKFVQGRSTSSIIDKVVRTT